MRIVTQPTPVIDVPEAFDEAAPSYDLMVALNPGYHRHLQDAAAALVDRLDDRPSGDGVSVVDLGCGSGASTRALVTALRRRRLRASVVGMDGSTGMLAQARAKSWPASVRFERGLAEDLAADQGDWGLREGADGVLAAYLFRNVADRDKVLRATYDLLAPGGTLVVQEYSVGGSSGVRLVWSAVCWLVVIPMSWLVSRETRLYRYLWRSVLDFDTVETFTARMQQAGFEDVESRTVRGWQRGILHTFRGRRAAATS